jgi:hypothetical protein
VPTSVSRVSPHAGGSGAVVRPGSAFHSGRATRSAVVSNTRGCSPCAGTLCDLLPAGSATSAGEPVAVSSVNASQVSAATPGLSS